MKSFTERKELRTVKHSLPGVALFALTTLVLPASAAEPMGTDLFAGYSFVRVDEVGRHGATTAASFRLFGPVAGFVDAGAHRGSDQGLDRSTLTVMAGPGVRFGTGSGIVFFVRAVAGLVRERASVSILDVDVSESENRLGVLAGGGIDVPVGRALALRAQGDYLWNDTSGSTSNGYRLSAGLAPRARPGAPWRTRCRSWS